MATKTISLELDAYEKLKRAKRGRESFSAVVRRAHFESAPSTGAAILKETEALYAAGKGASKKVIDYWNQSKKEDSSKPRVSSSKWNR